MSFRTKIAAVALTMTTVTAPTVLAPPTAQAALGDLTCALNAAYLTFTPPLKAGQSSSVNGYANLTGCVSLTSYGRLTRATIAASGTVTAAPGINPCGLILDMPLTGQVTWDTGETSDINVLLSTQLSSLPVLVGIDVTSGPLVGDSANNTVVPAPVPNLDCAIVGLQTLTVPVLAISFY
ncbi:hypothetical protein [Actinophytocola oryzae]|uniref:Secreted protein n=1 Tax=Actinophytocola oryzae TaxID=502181 RepID=A0A4R7VVA7_9PSEU|nr:hypothetical protein [Actinophytocola oryzae]TDV53940.1 hypothetical protein CLV71_104408 [Actinophytocola oryzae]